MTSDYDMVKDFHEAKGLREAWKAAGSKDCVHPSFMKEVLYAQATGDEYCLTCGFSRARGSGDYR